MRSLAGRLQAALRRFLGQALRRRRRDHSRGRTHAPMGQQRGAGGRRGTLRSQGQQVAHVAARGLHARGSTMALERSALRQT